MVDKDLIDRLHDEGFINKASVLWWQFGFEDRKVLSNDEFMSKLVQLSYIDDVIEYGEEGIITGVGELEQHFSVWPTDDVPITIENLNLYGEEDVPCFVTVKPMTHDLDEGWNLIKFIDVLGPSIIHSPHIRGVVAEVTDEFMFWYTLQVPGRQRNTYETLVSNMTDKSLPPVIFNSVDTNNFYMNLLKKNFKKTLEKPSEYFKLNDSGYSCVPYFEFNPVGKNVTVYPISLYEDRLDIPILIKGSKSGPEILGVPVLNDCQYPYNDIKYWKVDHSVEKKAKTSLLSRLGCI